MLRRPLSVVLSGLILCFAANAADELRRFSADDVFNLEWAADPQIDPAGKRIAYVRTSYDKLSDRATGAIWLTDVASGSQRPLITGSRSYGAPRWSPAGDRLAYRASGPNGTELRIRYLDDGSDFRVAQLFEHARNFVWSPDGKQLAFAMFVATDKPSFAKPPQAPKQAEWAEPVRVFDDLTYRFDGAGYLEDGATHVFTVSTEGGTPRQITDGENDFGSPAWLDNETLLAVGNDVEDAELDPIESEIYAIQLGDASRRSLTTRDGPDRSPVVSPNNDRIAYLGYDDQRKAWQQTDLYVMSADGTGTRNLTADFDHDLSSPAWSADGRSILALAEWTGELAIVRVGLDGSVAKVVDDAGGTSIGRPYASGAFSASANGRSTSIAYTRASPNRPAELAVISSNGRSRSLTTLNEDALGHIELAELEEIQLPSSHDGRLIEAWVAKPPGFSPDGSAPMIMEIHGGPYAMYGPSFAAEIQRFAAEGYVTVYVNPRGSTGYGEEFAQLIDRNYPSQDYDDLISVVDALVERDYVDPQRLFVTGGSGGGVLTAWIVGKTNRFAAAATIKPVINWTTMALTGDIAALVGRHWLRAQPWEDPELYWRLSPISLVGNVKTPTLVMVGEEDWRTPTWEAEQFYGALKLQKVPTALIRIPGASHAIASRPSRLIAKVDNIIAWFAQYDPDKTEAPATAAP